MSKWQESQFKNFIIYLLRDNRSFEY